MELGKFLSNNGKRIIFSAFSIAFFALSLQAQVTYYYEYTKRYESTGAVSKWTGAHYYTFTGEIMYRSDENGYKKDVGPVVNKFCGRTSDGNLMYKMYTETAGQGMWGDLLYIVSPDYSIINEKWISLGTTYVLERRTSPSNGGNSGTQTLRR